MSEYKKQLNSPLWRKRRKEILERDNWTCQDCGEVSESLHVHHKWYEYKAKPWEHSDECLISLCCSCHMFEHSVKKDYTEILINTILGKGFSVDSLLDMAYALSQMSKESILFELNMRRENGTR